jgi:hypothetical protein
MSGILVNLFPDKFKYSSEDKQQRSLGIAPSDRLQLLKSRYIKELKLENELGIKILMRSEPLPATQIFHGRSITLMRSFGIFSSLEQLDILREHKVLDENGNSFMAVPFKSRYHKDVILPTKSGSLLSLEQPERSRYSRDLDLILSTSLSRLLQSRRFTHLSRLRNPMDGWTLDKLVHFISSSFSRFGTPLKSGV